MEISRRHLQDTERAELRELLQTEGGLVDNPTAHSRFAELVHGDQHDAELEHMKDCMVEMSSGAIKHAHIQVHTRGSQLDAAEMQRQVDGLTRNQRRVLVKRMKKAKKK